MIHRSDTCQMLLFPSALGWMGVILKGNRLSRLTFGHASRTGAWKALGLEKGRGRIGRRATSRELSHFRRAKVTTVPPGKLALSPFLERLVTRLKAYARGQAVNFDDLEVNLEGYTAFQRRVSRACRQIPRGSTLSYGALAALLGMPRTARAVGNCMARNRIPLIIPCHRVISWNGRIGSYSAPGGKRMKKRLLEMEKRSPTNTLSSPGRGLRSSTSR
jgi:methylated-DNA-[protein]-cysteine S-methyltransferase